MGNETKPFNILIAAGGTGGHLFPAQALALELLQKHPNGHITFVGAGLKHNRYFKKELFPFLDIQSGTPFSKNPLKVGKACIKLAKGLSRCCRFYKKRKPDLIIGFGSFHTFPALLAAKMKNVPILIYESNVVPGKVNRFCSKWAKECAVQFSRTKDHLKAPGVCVHMPLLKGEEETTRKKSRAYFGLEENTFTFLIFGGSQGAHAINHFFCSTLRPLKEKGLTFQVIHIVGNQERAATLEKIYEQEGILASVKAFEEKMERAWAAADLSISRSGAATLSELIEYGVPSILIPYPYGTENHQLKNAHFVSKKVQGGMTIEEKDLKESGLTEAILSLLDNDQEKLKKMKGALKTYKEEEKKEDLSALVLKYL